MVPMKPYQDRTPDTQYRDLLKTIMENGKDRRRIQGGVSREIIGYEIRFSVENGFPVITERDLSGSFFRGAIGEHVGFLNGARTHEELKSYGCSWWSRWVTKEKCAMFGLEEGDLGPGSYGPAWTNFPTADGGSVNQIRSLVQQIREMPYLRTHEVSPWIPQYTLSSSLDNRKVVVAPCHGWVSVDVDHERKEIVVSHRQRSADAPVGLVANFIQYGVLGSMLAQILGYRFVELVYYITNAHIYERQFELVEELIDREPRRLPSIELDPTVDDLFAFRPEHFTLGDDYDPHPVMRIPTPI